MTLGGNIDISDYMFYNNALYFRGLASSSVSTGVLVAVVVCLTMLWVWESADWVAGRGERHVLRSSFCIDLLIQGVVLWSEELTLSVSSLSQSDLGLGLESGAVQGLNLANLSRHVPIGHILYFKGEIWINVSNGYFWLKLNNNQKSEFFLSLKGNSNINIRIHISNSRNTYG